MNSKLVIFDLDGTLYDKSCLPFYLVLRHWRHLPLLKAERKARKMLRGRAFDNESLFYDSFFELAGKLSGNAPATVSGWYFGEYLPSMAEILRKHCAARPWVQGMLDTLRSRGIRTAVLSDYGFVNEKLEALGIPSDCFDFIADTPSLGGLKPSVQVLERFLERAGVPAGDCLMAGDRDDTDGASARAVGMPFILVRGDNRPVLPADNREI